MNDVAVFDHINALSAEEEELFASASDGSGLTTEATERYGHWLASPAENAEIGLVLPVGDET